MKNVGIPLAGILLFGNRKGCPYKNDIVTQPLREGWGGGGVNQHLSE